MPETIDLASLLPQLARSQYISSGGRGITFTVQAAEAVSSDTLQAWKLVLYASEAVNMPNEVFVFQRKPFPSGAAPEYIDDFSNIASPPELEALPITEPGVGNPFFRLATVTLLFRSVSLLTDGLEEIYEDIQELVRTMDRLDVVDDIGSLRIGAPL